jgi:hypothetical protein
MKWKVQTWQLQLRMFRKMEWGGALRSHSWPCAQRSSLATGA